MRGGYGPRRPVAIIPWNHDHAGAMTFDLGRCWCRTCGATWVLTERGWSCVKSGGPDGR